MTFTLPPTAPSRGMTAAEFNAAADAYLAWNVAFAAELDSQFPVIQSAAEAATAIEGLGTAFAASVTPVTLTDNSDVVFAVGTGKGFQQGHYVRAFNSVSSWMSGLVKSYSAGNLTVAGDFKIGSGSFSSWMVVPAAKNSLPAGSVSAFWLGTSNALSLTPQTLALATAYQALTDAATIATNVANGVNFKVTIFGNRTMGAPTGTPIDGRPYGWRIQQGAGGPWTVNWDPIFKWSGNSPPVLSTALGAVDRGYGEWDAASSKFVMNFRPD